MFNYFEKLFKSYYNDNNIDMTITENHKIAKNEISPAIEQFLKDKSNEEIFNEVLKVINNRLYFYQNFIFSKEQKTGLEDNSILTKIIYELCQLPDKFFDYNDFFIRTEEDAYNRESLILLLSMYDIISTEIKENEYKVNTKYNEEALQKAIQYNKEHITERILVDLSKANFSMFNK
ncbi:hypothetical protein BCR32DRAFT_286001 [Anaeromyces robustus]|uniref:Uncharacterized protein n=1 Tax=Anaeromyces robustus TaxID=1754192 RepID=A0A1Y1W8V7_9FUNG|nr:hypothetical protein BCR32DRAFT_286001 [Anaeromyces robustus]|eukprot:ORX69835.1 hypothetical protein BCR32DRAFT_286001 [Anaeromyces robustus]